MIGPTRSWRRLSSPPYSNASSNGTILKRSKQLWILIYLLELIESGRSTRDAELAMPSNSKASN